MVNIYLSVKEFLVWTDSFQSARHALKVRLFSETVMLVISL